MTSPILPHRRVVLPILAGLAMVSLPVAAQQPGYGTSVVGAYNPYTQAGPGQTTGRAYGAPPVAPYPPGGPRPPVAGPAPAGQVGAYNPWRQQQPGGGGAPGVYAPPAPPPAADPGASLPPPPPGPIRSRLLSIPETGNPVGASGPFSSVPYVPRRSGAARPAVPPRTTVAAAPAPAQVANGGTSDSPPPAPTPTPRITNPPRAAAKPAPAPVVEPKPAPAVVIERPTQTVAAKPAPAPTVEPKPAPAAPVVAAAPPEPPKPAPPVPVAAKPPEVPKPAPAVVERPPQSAAAPPAGPLKPAVAGTIRVTFEASSPALSAEARTALDRLAADLIGDPARKTTLKAYSGGGGGPETRRLSLARGLAVRAYLIDKGVARERLDVQALGASADGGPADRVDAITGAGT